jgi:hypothetical protein
MFSYFQARFSKIVDHALIVIDQMKVSVVDHFVDYKILQMLTRTKFRDGQLICNHLNQLIAR